MNKKKTVWNATIAVVQVVVSAIMLFVLYKYLLNTLGVESLGIWSVVLATTSLSNISQFGLSGSVTKFVAKYLARKEVEKVEGVLKTAFVSIGVILLFALTLAYYPLAWVLSKVMPSDGLTVAMSLLPYALISMWFSSISGVVISGLDGCQRIDLRGILMIIGIILFTGLAITLIPDYGLLGLAYAQITQNIFVLIVGWWLVKREIISLPLIPIGWDCSLFKEMIRYGVNFQIAAIAMMLFESITKMLMTHFGGLAMTGYFEMANRMVLQFRAIIVAANQVIVPVVATLKERKSSQIKKLYIESFSLVLVLSLACYGFVIVITPYISVIWVGNYEPMFVFFAFMSLIGWGFNTLSGPAYFNNLGTGELFWNVIGSIIIGVVNALMGCFLGYFLGGTGVAMAYVLALLVGSTVIVAMYHKTHKIMLGDVLDKNSIKIVVACVIGCILGLMIYYTTPKIDGLPALFMLLVVSVILYLITVIFSLRNNAQVNKLLALFMPFR